MSRRLETPSHESDLSETQVETPNQDNDTLNNVNSNVQEALDDSEFRPQLAKPSQISHEIQPWTANFEQKNNDRIIKMREKIENKLYAILKEI